MIANDIAYPAGIMMVEGYEQRLGDRVDTHYLPGGEEQSEPGDRCGDGLRSNCDKITPGMLMAAAIGHPTVFVSGGPMEAGKGSGRTSVSGVWRQATSQTHAPKVTPKVLVIWMRRRLLVLEGGCGERRPRHSGVP